MPSRVFMLESRSVNNCLSSVLKPSGDGCGLNWKWLVIGNITFRFLFICSYILNMFFRRYHVFKVDLTLPCIKDFLSCLSGTEKLSKEIFESK